MKISILRLFGKIWTNIYKNKSTYLAVATVLQLTLLAGVWLISNIFRLALNFAGEDNLDKNNIYHIISNPISFILLIVLILTAAFFIFIEFIRFIKKNSLSTVSGWKFPTFFDS